MFCIIIIVVLGIYILTLINIEKSFLLFAVLFQCMFFVFCFYKIYPVVYAAVLQGHLTMMFFSPENNGKDVPNFLFIEIL